MKTKEDNHQVYELYGLRVHSELPLPAPLSQSLLPPYDIEVRFNGSRAIPADPNSARLLAKLDIGDRPVYTLIDTGRGYTLSFPQRWEFRISYNLRLVDAYLFPGGKPDGAGLLAVNGVIACILTLSGESVLHASAVEMGGRALAFVGGLGMGKSTLAALFCAMGARFITDDLLRLKPDGNTFYCFPGTGGIRLRKDASALADKFPETSQEETPDGRIELKLIQRRDPSSRQACRDDRILVPTYRSAIRQLAPWNSQREPYSTGLAEFTDGTPCRNHSLPPLEAIVIPLHRMLRRPAPDCKVLRLERLPASKAVLYLMSYLKMQGLQQREHIQCRLDFSAQLASSVPIFEAEIPWGIPALEETVPSLVKGLGFGGK